MHTYKYTPGNTYDEHGKAHKRNTVKDNLHTGYTDKGD
jgi:hypothetical protein